MVKLTNLIVMLLWYFLCFCCCSLFFPSVWIKKKKKRKKQKQEKVEKCMEMHGKASLFSALPIFNHICIKNNSTDTDKSYSAFRVEKPNRIWFTIHSASLTDGEMSRLTVKTRGLGLACNQTPLQNEKNAEITNSLSSTTSFTNFIAMLIDR